MHIIKQCMFCNHEMHLYFTKADKYLGKIFQYFKCTNSNCQIISISPQPTDDDLMQIYSKDYLGAWGNYDENEEFIVGQKMKSFAQFFNHLDKINRGSKVLDCGCAAGALLKLCASRGYEAFGFDINPYAIEKASRFVPSDHLFVADDISKIAIKENSLYAIFMIDYIEHLRNPLQTISIAHNLLRKGGYLVITTPDASHCYPRFLRKNYWYFSPQHIHIFNKRNVASLFAENGFTVEKVKTFRKALSILYLSKIFITYYSHHWKLFDKFILKLIPISLQKKVFHFGTAEMLVILRRK